jgi:hypothetical protein
MQRVAKSINLDKGGPRVKLGLPRRVNDHGRKLAGNFLG